MYKFSLFSFCCTCSSSLSGLLDEERLASAHQAESFTRQIQRLQGSNTHFKRFMQILHVDYKHEDSDSGSIPSQVKTREHQIHTKKTFQRCLHIPHFAKRLHFRKMLLLLCCPEMSWCSKNTLAFKKYPDLTNQTTSKLPHFNKNIL